MREENSLGGVYECRRLAVFLDDVLGEFATLATFTGDSQLGLNVSKIAGTTSTDIADLVVSNLSANTYVHGKPQCRANINLNENDCQQDLDLLDCIS